MSSSLVSTDSEPRVMIFMNEFDMAIAASTTSLWNSKICTARTRFALGFLDDRRNHPAHDVDIAIA
jgi:hypothetical protein